MAKPNRVALRILRVVLLLAIATSLPRAQASVLGNRRQCPPDPLFPGGTLLASISGTVTVSTFSTSYTEWVFSDPLNVWCANCLDFVYQFTDMGPASNSRFEMYSFTGFFTEVGTDPFGVDDPVSIDRSLDGSLIGFNYNPSVAAGVTTPWLVIETDALSYTLGGYVNVLGRVGSSGTVTPAQAYSPVLVPGFLP